MTAALQVQQAQTDAKPVKVKVVAPYRVSHEGEPYTDGDQVTVPADKADQWIQAGWVKPVRVSQRGKK